MLEYVTLKNYIASVGYKNLLVFVAVCVNISLEIFKTFNANVICVFKRLKFDKFSTATLYTIDSEVRKIFYKKYKLGVFCILYELSNERLENIPTETAT